MSLDKDCVKVTKVTKVPSQFYTPNLTYITNVKNTVKIELETKTVTNTIKLDDALTNKHPILVSIKDGMGKSALKVYEKMKVVCKYGLHFIKYFVIDNTKKIAVSGSTSMFFAGVAGTLIISTCSLGYQVTLGDRVIGVVKDASAYYEVLSDVKEEVSEISDITFEPVGELNISKMIIPKGKFTQENEIKERLRSTCKDMIPAYAIVVDHKQVLALVNEQMAIDVLNEYKNDYLHSSEAQASFGNNVEVEFQFVPKSILKNKETALSSLREGKFINYIATPGDTLDNVANKFNITKDDLLQTNVIENVDNLANKKLKIYTKEPIIQVKTVEHIKGEESIPFETVQQKDNSKYKGSVNIIQRGEEGKRFVEAYVTKVNGVEKEKQVLQENILKTPVKQIEKIGARDIPAPIGTGLFATPASGRISSRFGSRWGRHHDGIDYAASVGTPILAADTGKVIYAQYDSGGYGKLIKIDHSNGFITYYAHCSEIMVNVGDIVSKGDKIGKVGNTGRSTGPHLHFEVRKDGVAYDPLAYLNN